jgi:hypothetical protein
LIIDSNNDDEFSVFPRLDITSDIYLMGDYYSTNYDQMKAYTNLKIKFDYYNVVKAANLSV